MHSGVGPSFVRLTAAGAAPDWRKMEFSRGTGFPFHLPADLQEGTNHITGAILADMTAAIAARAWPRQSRRPSAWLWRTLQLNQVAAKLAADGGKYRQNNNNCCYKDPGRRFYW
jgi:hypothetical protein